MRSRARRLPAIVAALVIVVVSDGRGDARTIGQVIDDTAIAAKIKMKLTADRLGNLTAIDVKVDQGVVTLSGAVDSAQRRARAEQIAGEVQGVNGVVNNIVVRGDTAAAPDPSPPETVVPASRGAVDVTGRVARVEEATGTIVLEDGRVVRTTDQSVVWQPSTLGALRPGSQVLVRRAEPVGFGTGAPAAAEWRMATVSRVDREQGRIVLGDGTVVRVAPSTSIHRGTERLTLDRLEPGSEVVVHTRPPAADRGPAAGSALPRPTATAATIDASDVEVVWPRAGAR